MKLGDFKAKEPVLPRDFLLDMRVELVERGSSSIRFQKDVNDCFNYVDNSNGGVMGEECAP